MGKHTTMKDYCSHKRRDLYRGTGEVQVPSLAAPRSPKPPKLLHSWEHHPALGARMVPPPSEEPQRGEVCRGKAYVLVSFASFCMISKIILQAAEQPSGVEWMLMAFSAAPAFSFRCTSILQAGDGCWGGRAVLWLPGCSAPPDPVSCLELTLSCKVICTQGRDRS